MNIYRIRSKYTGEFFRSDSLCTSLDDALGLLRDYNHLKNYKEWMDQWEVVKYELVEICVYGS